MAEHEFVCRGMYIGGVAYVARNASLKLIADRLQTRNQRPQRRWRA